MRVLAISAASSYDPAHGSLLYRFSRGGRCVPSGPARRDGAAPEDRLKREEPAAYTTVQLGIGGYRGGAVHIFSPRYSGSGYTATCSLPKIDHVSRR
jgi:hypothetical protein